MGKFDRILRLPFDQRVKPLVSSSSSVDSGEIPVGGILYATMGRGSTKKYQVVESLYPGSCRGCDFYNGFCCDKTKKATCSAYSRADKTWVIFKLIKK